MYVIANGPVDCQAKRDLMYVNANGPVDCQAKKDLMYVKANGPVDCQAKRGLDVDYVIEKGTYRNVLNTTEKLMLRINVYLLQKCGKWFITPFVSRVTLDIKATIHQVA